MNASHISFRSGQAKIGELAAYQQCKLRESEVE